MKQEISQLLPPDFERLETQRAEIKRHIVASDLGKFETTQGKLAALRAVINASLYTPEQTFELQCMGVVLGDAFVQELGCDWAIVEDDYGRDPALKFEGTSILLFPLTMISKRIEKGEDVDVFEVFNGVADRIRDLKEELAERT